MSNRFNYDQMGQTPYTDAELRRLGVEHDEENSSYGRVPFNETDEYFNNPNIRLQEANQDNRAMFEEIYKKQQAIKKNKNRGFDLLPRQQQTPQQSEENAIQQFQGIYNKFMGRKRENLPNTQFETQSLFENKFIDPTIDTTRDDTDAVRKQNAYRKYYEDKIQTSKLALPRGDTIFDDANKELQRKAIDLQATLDPHDLILTNAVNDIRSFEAENIRAINQQAGEEQRFFKNERILVNVDSRDRDQQLYPFPSHYKVDLGKEFVNIKKIVMRSSEFPNTEQLIRDTPIEKQNNKIFWQNEGSNDIFTASIPPGNYRPSSLQTQIQTAMNQVRRDENNFHEFTVTIDTVSDICTFSSLTSRQVAQPFFTTAGTSIILAKVSGHGFTTGQLINVSGTSAFAGVNLARVNTNHVITKIDDDQFTFDIGDLVVTTAGNDVDGGVGGNQVRLGTGLPFRLLFTQPGTPANILGFEASDTPFGTIQTNTVIARTYDIEQVKSIDSIFSAVLMSSASITPENPVTFGAADRIFITGVAGTSSDQLINIASGYLISPLTSVDTTTLGYTTEQASRAFKIPAVISSATNGSGGNVFTRTLNRPVALAGENYMFMVINPIRDIVIGDMSNTGSVDNIFAKIDLSAPPGNILFNTFISNGKTFLNTPLRQVRELEFSFRAQDGSLFDFIDSDHSFTLEIVSQVHRTTGNSVAYNDRLGISDET